MARKGPPVRALRVTGAERGDPPSRSRPLARERPRRHEASERNAPMPRKTHTFIAFLAAAAAVLAVSAPNARAAGTNETYRVLTYNVAGVDGPTGVDPI